MWRTANQLLCYVLAWLSVNHWWYQLLSQSWGAQVWCLWQLLPRWTVVVTIAASDPHLLFLNRCVIVDFFHSFLCSFSCVFVINRNAFCGQLMHFRRTAGTTSPPREISVWLIRPLVGPYRVRLGLVLVKNTFGRLQHNDIDGVTLTQCQMGHG